MSRRAQKLPEEYQEGSYKRRKSGKNVNVGKPIKNSTRNASGTSGSGSRTSARSQPPPVPLRHFGEQNDMDTGLDYFNLDPQLPTLEEVRRSYGKVRLQIYLATNGLSYSKDSKSVHGNVAPKTRCLSAAYYHRRRNRG